MRRKYMLWKCFVFLLLCWWPLRGSVPKMTSQMSHRFKGVDVILAKGKQLVSGDYTHQSALRMLDSRLLFPETTFYLGCPWSHLYFQCPFCLCWTAWKALLTYPAKVTWEVSKPSLGERVTLVCILNSSWVADEEPEGQKEWVTYWGSQYLLVCPQVTSWHASGPAHTLLLYPLRTQCTPPFLKEKIPIAEITIAHALCPDIYDYSS